MTPARAERGYAMVAAVAAIAVFALAALTIINMTRATLVSGAAEVDQAQAAAAADAGVALALNGLLTQDRANRWSIDGRLRQMRFESAELRIRIEDEQGKIPLNRVDETILDPLFIFLHLDGERADIARDSFLDWIDDDDEALPFGAEADYYRKSGIHPRNSGLQSIDELTRVRGFDAALVDRMRSFVTVDAGSASFDARFARPEAIDILLGGGIATPAGIARQRELNGQTPAIELGDTISLTGRPLTIVVEARLANGARAERRVIVELTGSLLRPYVIQAYH